MNDEAKSANVGRRSVSYVKTEVFYIGLDHTDTQVEGVFESQISMLLGNIVTEEGVPSKVDVHIETDYGFIESDEYMCRLCMKPGQDVFYHRYRIRVKGTF